FPRVTARGFARDPFAPFPPEASPPRITPLRGSVAIELNRQLPQRIFHPLDTSAFRGALQSFPSGRRLSPSRHCSVSSRVTWARLKSGGKDWGAPSTGEPRGALDRPPFGGGKGGAGWLRCRCFHRIAFLI